MGTVHAKTTDPPKTPEDPFAMPFIPQPDLDLPKRNVDYEKCDPNEREIDIDGIKARVDRIHVEGLSRTKNDIIEDCFEDLFKASNFQDVLIKAHQSKIKLEELGCFKNIAVFIDTSKGLGSTPDGLDVTFNVNEYRRLTGGVSTHVGNNEGALLVGLRAPNIFGRGEKVQMEYTHGSKKSSNFNVALIKPFRGKYRPIFTTSVFQSTAEVPPSGYKLLSSGLQLDFGFHSHALVKHNIQWEGVIRNVCVLGKGSCFNIREESGATLKSAIRHIFSADLRDDMIFPTGGSLVQVTTELSGLGGNVGFMKNDVFVQSNVSLIEDIVLQMSAGAGYMRGLNNDMKIGLPDMFFLGGPLSLRGFQMRGVGPHSDGDALGAVSYWSTGLHLFTPLPFRPGRGGFGELFRTHFFVNAGNIGDFKVVTGEPFLPVFTENMRVSYGLGLALRLGNMARVEVNYCFPYMYDSSDQVQPGIQFGIGVQFL